MVGTCHGGNITTMVMIKDLLEVVLNRLVRVGLILSTMVGIMLGNHYHHD